MKNKFIYFITLLFFNLLISNAHAEELSISANTVEFDDISKVLILNGDVTAVDEDQNKVFASRARYNKKENLFETFGKTTIITNSGYNIEGENILFDNKLKKISSKSNTVIVDLEKNKISVDMFDYLIKKKFFFFKR